MRISTFEFDLSQPLPPTKQDDIVVSNYMPPIKEAKPKGRQYIPKHRESYGPYIARVLEQNEYLRYENEWHTDKELQYEFLRTNNNRSLRAKFKNHKLTINYLRTLYNRRELYSAQPPFFLISLRYNDAGIIEPDGRSAKYMHFIECYKRCLESKIADPRFIEPEKIVAIRDRINSGDQSWVDWWVPSDEWIATFTDKIGQPPYNSVYFPPGWTREESPSIEEFD